MAFEAAKELELQQVRPRQRAAGRELRAKVAAFEKEKQAEIDALTREAAAAVNILTRLQTRQRAEEERFHRTISLFVEPMPARVIPMASGRRRASRARASPAHAPEAKSELKLVAPIPPAAAAPAAPAAEVKPAAKDPAAPTDPSKDEAKS